MKKIILLLINLMLFSVITKAQLPFLTSGDFDGGVWCNSYITFYDITSKINYWKITSNSKHDIPVSVFVKDSTFGGDHDSTRYITTNKEFITDVNTFTIYNLPVDTYIIYWNNVPGSFNKEGHFITISCLGVQGDTISNTDTSLNIFCSDSLQLTYDNIYDTASKLIWNINGVSDTTLRYNTFHNLPVGADTITITSLANKYDVDKLFINVENCYDDIVNPLSDAIVHNKNCTGDSILKFKFNYVTHTNSDTAFYFNYSKFNWVLKDSIGKTIDSTQTSSDSISVEVISSMKGNDTLFCSASNEYYDTTLALPLTIDICNTPTAVQSISTQDLKAYVYNGTLYLSDNRNIIVEVSDILGHYTIYDIGNRNTLSLPPGFGIATIYRGGNYLQSVKFVNIQ